ncbi:hypothetical protein [Bacillus weihaiensis]|nr:hypothetical protein [Bacillus weihaiensis]
MLIIVLLIVVFISILSIEGKMKKSIEKQEEMIELLKQMNNKQT